MFCAIRRRSCHLRRLAREKSWDDGSKESRMARAESGLSLMTACAASSAARSFPLPTQAASRMVATMMYNSFRMMFMVGHQVCPYIFLIFGFRTRYIASHLSHCHSVMLRSLEEKAMPTLVMEL
ncbi:MAG: hypothetical protein J6Y23_11920 [Prevotella sp.]|nr:hypothetical protein [Prevotella sp.]